MIDEKDKEMITESLKEGKEYFRRELLTILGHFNDGVNTTEEWFHIVQHLQHLTEGAKLATVSIAVIEGKLKELANTAMGRDDEEQPDWAKSLEGKKPN